MDIHSGHLKTHYFNLLFYLYTLLLKYIHIKYQMVNKVHRTFEHDSTI